MTRTIRMFKGTTEYYPSSIKIELLTEKAVDSATVEIKPCDLNVGDEVTFYKSDGTTKIFAGKIIDKKIKKLWELKVLGYGWELNNLWITQVYENKSPEYIVEDIITNYTNFTYASTSSSGVTLTKYVANDYAYKIIDEMASILDWQFYTDADKNAYFEPKGTIDNGVVFTNGTNCRVEEWREDPTKLVNKVKVKGDFASYNTTETFTGDGSTTEFALSYKPVSNIKVVVDGTELSGGAEGKGDYDIDKEQKKIIFSSAPANGSSIEISYTYNIPIVVQTQDDDSIALYGEIYKEVEVPSLKTFADARAYAKQYLATYSTPASSVAFRIAGINTTIQQGEKIRVIDSLRSKDEYLIINKIKYLYPEGVTEVEAGEIYYTAYDWQKEVQERIKELEKKLSNEEFVLVHRLLEGNLKITLTATITKKKRAINDSFILGHSSNGILGTSELGDRRGAWETI